MIYNLYRMSSANSPKKMEDDYIKKTACQLTAHNDCCSQTKTAILSFYFIFVFCFRCRFLSISVRFWAAYLSFLPFCSASNEPPVLHVLSQALDDGSAQHFCTRNVLSIWFGRWRMSASCKNAWALAHQIIYYNILLLLYNCFAVWCVRLVQFI